MMTYAATAATAMMTSRAAHIGTPFLVVTGAGVGCTGAGGTVFVGNVLTLAVGSADPGFAAPAGGGVAGRAGGVGGDADFGGAAGAAAAGGVAGFGGADGAGGAAAAAGAPAFAIGARSA